MRRIMNLAWLLVSLMAMGAALVVTLAHAAPAPRDPDVLGWSKEERAVLASLSLRRLPPVPIDPSNAVEGLPAAIELGRRLFADARFSADGAVSCASCHDPRKQFQDGLPVSRGVGTGTRRAMPIVGAGYSSWLFWDGRKDSLWAQALGPLEDAVEHGGNRTRHAHLLASNYRKAYESLFGTMPKLESLPRDAGPHGAVIEKAVWAAMDAGQRDAVSRVFANMGKAIAAYEKSLRHGASRLDRYVDAVADGRKADLGALQPGEVRGLRLFIGKGQCVTCHNGPLFTDQQFHNTGVPQRDPARPDHGRADATAKVRSDEFNCLGPFSDARPTQCQELRFMVDDDPTLVGAFKTPGLRGVAQRAPFMHAGQMATLEQVVRHYVAAPHAAVGHTELTHRHAGGAALPRHDERAPIELTDAEVTDLVSFLGTLGAEPTSALAASSDPRPEPVRASLPMGSRSCHGPTAVRPFAADFDPESLRQPQVPLGLVITDKDVNQVPRCHADAVRAACKPRCEVLQRLAEGGQGAMLSPMPPLQPGSAADKLQGDLPSFDRAATIPRLHADGCSPKLNLVVCTGETTVSFLTKPRTQTLSQE